MKMAGPKFSLFISLSSLDTRFAITGCHCIYIHWYNDIPLRLKSFPLSLYSENVYSENLIFMLNDVSLCFAKYFKEMDKTITEFTEIMSI